MNSEYGRGIVVCLVKFSEHLNNKLHRRCVHIKQVLEASPEQLAKWQEEAKGFPESYAARRLQDALESDLSTYIELWMNGASNHFYELDDKAPESLKQLAHLCLRIGHGFTGETWTWDTVVQVHNLWKQACFDVDKMLGLADVDWGNY